MEVWLLPLGLVALVLGGLGWWFWLRSRPVTREPLPSPFAEIAVETTEIDGFKIRYHRSGRGPPLVALHGIGANLYCWRWILPKLGLNFEVVAPDLPGFGQSSKPKRATYGLDEQTQRLARFLDRIGVGPCYIVGNSMGGNIALWFAFRYPERVKGVAVIAPATSPRLVPPGLRHWSWMASPVARLLNRSMMDWAHARTVSKRELVDAARIEETFLTYGRNPEAVRSFILATETIRDPRLFSALEKIVTPVLILWGSRDRLVSRGIIDALEAALPKAESEVHIGGGHHLQEDEPELTSFFLSKLD